MMSQQEKLALKAAQEGKKDTKKGAGASSSKTNVPSLKKDAKDGKKKDQYLRPCTPPNRTGSKPKDDEGNSPASEACTSGTVTPTSEGVRRVDRKVMHAPPGGLDL